MSRVSENAIACLTEAESIRRTRLSDPFYVASMTIFGRSRSIRVDRRLSRRAAGLSGVARGGWHANLSAYYVKRAALRHGPGKFSDGDLNESCFLPNFSACLPIFSACHLACGCADTRTFFLPSGKESAISCFTDSPDRSLTSVSLINESRAA